MGDQVYQPYKRTTKIIVFNISVFYSCDNIIYKSILTLTPMIKYDTNITTMQSLYTTAQNNLYMYTKHLSMFPPIRWNELMRMIREMPLDRSIMRAVL
jgi:hypothetical protein